MALGLAPALSAFSPPHAKIPSSANSLVSRALQCGPPIFYSPSHSDMGFLGGSVVQSLPATQATQARLLGEKGPLEWETAAHSSILFLENQESFLIVQVK